MGREEKSLGTYGVSVIWLPMEMEYTFIEVQRNPLKREVSDRLLSDFKNVSFYFLKW